MTDEYATDQRVALDLERMSVPGSLQYKRVSTSTQADAKLLLDRGERAPFTVITEEQTEGRGRLDRTWTAPPYTSVLMSMALPEPGHASAFTLKVGVVVAEALIARGVPARLKWPNDIVVVEADQVRKLGGILAELHRGHVVVGIGLNISMRSDELPTPDAVSCRQLGSTPRREYLVMDIANGLVGLPAAATLERYRELSATIGADVAVTRISGESLVGRVSDIDADGALLVRDAAGAEHRVTVGDVEHLRTGSAT